MRSRLVKIIISILLGCGASLSIAGSIFAQGEERFDGRINDSSPEVRYILTLEAGVSVLIETEALSGDLDTTLRLFAPNGAEIAFNDDGFDDSLNSIVGHTVIEGGDYTVVVGRYWGSKSEGAFRLRVTYGDEDLVIGLGGPLILSGAIETVQTQHFIVYFTQSGVDRTDVAYAKAAALMLEEMLEKQVAMGWTLPPTNSSGLIPVYIADILPDGAMGYTGATGLVGDNPNTARIEHRTTTSMLALDNDFSDMDGDPLSLLRTTATHELNHALQAGYDPDDPLHWYYEATASWIETVTADEDQDATRYVDLNFEHPDICLGGDAFDSLLYYGDWTLMQSLEDQFGEGAVVRLWDHIADYDGLLALEAMTKAEGSNLLATIATWRVQNLARDYALAPLFTRSVALEGTVSRLGDSDFAGVEGLGVHYLEFDLPPGGYDVSLWAKDYGLLAYVIGVTEAEVVAEDIGKGATIDTRGFDHVYLMILNMRYEGLRADCNGLAYTLRVESSDNSPVQIDGLRLDGSNFFRPRS